jgi:hypothetical protein
MPLTKLWSTWTLFTFQYPSQRCPSSQTSSIFNHCIESVTSTPYTLINFISYKLSLHIFITITSPSEHLTIHSFRLNYFFNPFYKSLLTENIFVCNLDTWRAYFMQIMFVITFTITSLTLDSIPISFHDTIINHVDIA